MTDLMGREVRELMLKDRNTHPNVKKTLIMLAEQIHQHEKAIASLAKLLQQAISLIDATANINSNILAAAQKLETQHVAVKSEELSHES